MNIFVSTSRASRTTVQRRRPQIGIFLTALFLLVVGTARPGYGAEAVATPPALPPPDAEGFISLFDGNDLKGWDGDPKLWSVQDGAIVGETTAALRTSGTYLFRAGVTMTNFELRASFRLLGGNSGIQYRSRELPDWQVAGYQADMDDANAYTGIIYEVGGRAIMAPRGQKLRFDPAGNHEVLGSLGSDRELLAAIKPRDWNEYTIIARGDHLIQKINGRVMVDVVDQDARRIRSGLIAFQLHPGPPMRVEFKNVRYKPLPATPESAPAPAPRSGLAPRGDVGGVVAKANEAAATPVERIKMAVRDFKVELLYSPPSAQGSWDCMCVDPKGRLIVCDQYDQGLYRITPAPPGGKTGETKVEKINVNLSGAQGLVWAANSLYVLVTKNGKSESGLYRVRAAHGDDQLDTVELLRPLEGGGDHGWHELLLAPDGKSIYVVAGDATTHPDLAASRVPMIWGEDHLLPRIPDARGFMVNVLAPGGCFYRVDFSGQRWELLSVGFRNAYAAAFNRDGELFTDDADMEWDMNTPWYRPTRVCLVTSGSEFGWRNGSGKWPPYYADNLPPVLDIGPGSPTGMTFGYGAKFPARYQDAFFVGDWSYGRMLAVHLTPDGSAYKGETELFMTGTPLPITAMLIDPKDGAMYFITGGWRIQTGLYRVTYVGPESTAPARPDSRGAQARAVRRKLERFHGHQDPHAVTEIWPCLGNSDRFIRFAARVALEWQDPATWRERALNEADPEKALTALLALVRVSGRDVLHRKPTDTVPAPTLQANVLAALDRLDWHALTDPQRLELTRVYAVTFTRLGEPDETARRGLIAKFEPLFPAGTRELNAELCKLLVYLQSPGVAQKALAMVAKAPTQEEQIEYIKSLRMLKAGWTPDLRRVYFEWFLKAAGYRGGASFAGFMRLIKNDAVATLTEQEKAALKPVLDARPPAQSPLEAMRQGLAGHAFVKAWTVNELAPQAEHGLTNRDYDRGRKLFGAVGCFACHRFANEGGAVGPDLTSAGGRFSPRDLLEAILEPSKTVSDLYASVNISRLDGDTITGRIVYLGGDNVQVNVDMFDPSQTVTIDRKQIKSMELSRISPMPEGLLDVLAPDEILDLMAYVLSGGDSGNKMFRHVPQRLSQRR